MYVQLFVGKKFFLFFWLRDDELNPHAKMCLIAMTTTTRPLTQLIKSKCCVSAAKA